MKNVFNQTVAGYEKDTMEVKRDQKLFGYPQTEETHTALKTTWEWVNEDNPLMIPLTSSTQNLWHCTFCTLLSHKQFYLSNNSSKKSHMSVFKFKECELSVVRLILFYPDKTSCIISLEFVVHGYGRQGAKVRLIRIFITDRCVH